MIAVIQTCLPRHAISFYASLFAFLFAFHFIRTVDTSVRFLCRFPFLTFSLSFCTVSPFLSFSTTHVLHAHTKRKKKLFQPMHIMDSVHISIVWYFVVLLFSEAKMINIESRTSFSFDDSLFTLFFFFLLLLLVWRFFHIGPLYCDTDSNLNAIPAFCCTRTYRIVYA